jgi:chromosome segregation ATPase
VRQENSDEYQQVDDIKSRHKVLVITRKELKAKLTNLNTQIDEKKGEMATYQNKMETEIMTLNNSISTLNKDAESIALEKTKLKGEEEELIAKQSAKVSELSRVFMAVDNLENVCYKRAEDPNINTVLKYRYDLIKPSLVKVDKFELDHHRMEVASTQLQVIA